jgi:replication factor C small subunit
MRRAENTLQACAVVSNIISIATVKQVVSFAEPEEIKKMIMSALRGDFIGARGLLHDLMTKSGLSGLDVVKQVQRQVWDLTVSDSVKVELVKRVGEYEFRMVEGSNEVIQLTAMLADFTCLGR